MADQIHIRDLLVRTILGINDDERTNRQDVLLNVTLDIDARPASRSDDIECAVNYRTLTKQMLEFVEGSSYLLVETLAEELARMCLADERVQAVEITVDKPGALRFARSVGVTIRRTRADL
jgi:dihydroneopterin aldolase/D-erythro-7,8-dihydroneopterin triphosphate epimerase